MNQIRYFLAVCAGHNFKRAARRCGVARPSLTRAIKLLEKELGGPLFVRGRGQSRLSALDLVVRRHRRRSTAARREYGKRPISFLPPVHKWFEAMEALVRIFIYSAAATAAILVAATFKRTIPPATASPPSASRATIDPCALQSTIDTRRLPAKEAPAN